MCKKPVPEPSGKNSKWLTVYQKGMLGRCIGWSKSYRSFWGKVPENHFLQKGVFRTFLDTYPKFRPTAWIAVRGAPQKAGSRNFPSSVQPPDALQIKTNSGQTTVFLPKKACTCEIRLIRFLLKRNGVRARENHVPLVGRIHQFAKNLLRHIQGRVLIPFSEDEQSRHTDLGRVVDRCALPQ